MGKYLCVIVGVVSILAGGWGVHRWWLLVLGMVKGGASLVLILGGVIAVVAGITEIRDTAALRKQP